MITAEIKLGTEYSTHVSADTIEEIIQKIKAFHTMNAFEIEHYTEKGTLEKELASGWYLK